MGALIEINTDGLAKLAEIVGDWTGLNARASKSGLAKSLFLNS